MIGVYINCSQADFIGLMFSKSKLYETRGRDTLRSIAGYKVALVDSSGRVPMVRGFAVFRRSGRHDRTSKLWPLACLAGTTYDTDGPRWFYSVDHVQSCKPFPVRVIRSHGRSWSEFTRA